MKKLIPGLMADFAALAAQAAVTVSNVSAAQTPGTKQVRIVRDVPRALHLLCTRLNGIMTAIKEKSHA